MLLLLLLLHCLHAFIMGIYHCSWKTIKMSYIHKLSSVSDIHSSFRVLCISQACDHTLHQISSVEDINWYKQQFGPEMPYNWPVYEVQDIACHARTSDFNSHY